MARSYTYDRNYRVTSQTFSGPGAGGADPVGGTYAYTYDDADRLSGYTEGTNPAQAITHDPNGNRTAFGPASFTYNTDDTIATSTAGTPHVFTYDASGRQTSDGCNTFTYDGFDRTHSLGLALGAPIDCDTSTTAGAYAYDALDRQLVNPKDSGTAVYDGLGGGTSYPDLRICSSQAPGRPVGTSVA